MAEREFIGNRRKKERKKEEIKKLVASFLHLQRARPRIDPISSTKNGKKSQKLLPTTYLVGPEPKGRETLQEEIRKSETQHLLFRLSPLRLEASAKKNDVLWKGREDGDDHLKSLRGAATSL